MHPELERLIDMAVADGELTAKEQAVILRKAAALGEDPDETEIIMHGKLAVVQRSRVPVSQAPVSSTPPPAPTTTERQQTVRKCPACGTMVTAFQTICDACGHEFQGVAESAVIKRLSGALEKAADVSLKKGFFEGRDVFEQRCNKEIVRKRSEIIRNFPIPNAREDILELLHFIDPKIQETNSSDPQVLDWLTKIKEILGRALGCSILGFFFMQFPCRLQTA